jgi:hypothetical protein
MNKVNNAGYNEATKFGPSKNNPPYISDDFQIGPDGAYEAVGEDNNGWIKIESESDLPEETIDCHFITSHDNIIRIGIYHFGLKEFKCGNSYFDKITHYQPIKKPLNTLY